MHRLTGLQYVLPIVISGILCLGISAQSESERVHASGHVTFRYKNEWTVKSDPAGDSERISLADEKDDSQILIVVSSTALPKKNSSINVKKQVLDPWVEHMVELYDHNGIKVEREAITTEIAGQPSDGTRLRFTLDGRATVGDAFWAVVDNRPVILYFLRFENAPKHVGECWDLVRTTIRSPNDHS